MVAQSHPACLYKLGNCSQKPWSKTRSQLSTQLTTWEAENIWERLGPWEVGTWEASKPGTWELRILNGTKLGTWKRHSSEWTPGNLDTSVPLWLQFAPRPVRGWTALKHPKAACRWWKKGRLWFYHQWFCSEGHGSHGLHCGARAQVREHLPLYLWCFHNQKWEDYIRLLYILKKDEHYMYLQSLSEQWQHI